MGSLLRASSAPGIGMSLLLLVSTKSPANESQKVIFHLEAFVAKYMHICERCVYFGRNDFQYSSLTYLAS